MPTTVKPRKTRAERKRRAKAKATTRRQTQPRWLRFSRAQLLMLPVVLAFPLAAYFFGFGGGGPSSTAGLISELQYRPDVVATTSVGEEFTLGTFRYEVGGAVNRGHTYGFQKAEGRFIEVAITAENIGKAKATPNAIGLIDGDGIQYAQVPQFSLDGTRYSEVLKQGLEPGGMGTFFALFDVATSSAGPWVSFHTHDGIAAQLVWLGM